MASMRRAVSERRSSSTFCRQPCHEAVCICGIALPQLVEEIGAVRIPEQKVKFIGKDPCGFSFLPVLDHTVEDGVQRDQHADGHELLAKLPDVVGDDPGFGIHIGALGKSVQTAGDEQFGGKRQPLASGSGCFKRV